MLVVAEISTAVEVEMAVAAISLAPANDTATVRVLSSADCALALVVTPVAMVTVHTASAARFAVFAVNNRAAVAPDPLEATS